MRIALATINPTIGDPQGNAALIERATQQAREAGADLVLLPELCLSGYPPKDLLTQEGFVAACWTLARQVGVRNSAGLTLVFGVPLPHDPAQPGRGPVHNSLLAFRDGTLLATYHKRLLPTYDVFDEDRYFEPGDQPCVVEVPTKAGRTWRAGLSICEDLWKGEDAGFASRYRDRPDPVPPLIGKGAELILSASASPFVLGKGQKHVDILRAHARRHNVWVASVNQLGGNDDLVFDGHRYLVAPGGELAAGGGLFSDAPLVFDLPPPPRVPGVAAPAMHKVPDERLLFDALVLGVRDYLRKTGFARAIIGLSGGIDSALTAVLACAALKPGNVQGVLMPGPYSSEHSVRDARDIAQRLGIQSTTVPLARPFSGFTEAMNQCFRELGVDELGRRLPDVTEENLQSRIRGTILMTLSNRTGAMVLTTGNKSELAVGYATLYGDMNGGLAVLSDVNKQWIYRLSRWINQNHAACGFAGEPIPQSSITKAPSAELRPDQTDLDSLPPYEVLDRIIDLCIETKMAPDSIARETGFDRALVERIVRMINVAEYKRRQAAVGLKVTSVAFGSGRRYPIAQRWLPGSAAR